MRRKQKSNTESFALSKPRLILKDDGSRLVDADAREQCGEGGDIQDVTRQNHSVTPTVRFFAQANVRAPRQSPPERRATLDRPYPPRRGRRVG